MNAPVILRVLTAADIPAAQRLRALAGWNQTDDDWRNLLAFEPDGCFAAELNGELVGTATTTRHGGGTLGWIGMVLVDPAQRRHGIGSALLNKCIEHLDAAGVETIKLDATPLGKKVYDNLGLRDEFALERWEGIAQGRNCGCDSITPFKEGDVTSVAEFDAQIFGANREHVLQAWWNGWPECALVSHVDGRVAGYALARRGTSFHQVGPVIANTPALRETLLCEALRRVGEHSRVVIDFVATPATTTLAERLGLKLQRPLTRMVRGPNSLPGQPNKILAICCPEIG